MSNFKSIAVIAIFVALFLCILLVIPSLFAEEDVNFEISGYSPVSVNPPPENVSEPEEISKPEELDSYTLAVDAIMNNLQNFKVFFASSFDREAIEKINETCGPNAVEALATGLENGEVL